MDDLRAKRCMPCEGGVPKLDVAAITDNKSTVTPLRIDMTDEPVMATLAEPAREHRPGALVHQESHLLAVGMRRHELGVLKRLGREQEAGLNVVCRQLGILTENLLNRRAMAEQVQDVFHS